MHAQPSPIQTLRAARVEGSDLSYIAVETDKLRAAFDTGRTRPYEWRVAQLDALVRMVEVEESAILAALNEDLGKQLAALKELTPGEPLTVVPDVSTPALDPVTITTTIPEPPPVPAFG